jgi:hypothetical protein
MSLRIQVVQPGIYPDLIAALETTGAQVVLAQGTTGKVEPFEIIESVYLDEPQQPPVAHYRPTHKGKVVAQWKNERRGRRP